MDIFDLKQKEIEVLFLRCQRLTPVQIQLQLNISSTEFFERQKTALTRLDIPGEAKEKWGNFERRGCCETVSKLTKEDIQNWYDRRDNLRTKFSSPTNQRSISPMIYAVVALVILALGVILGRFIFSPQSASSATSTQSQPTPESTLSTPPSSETSIVPSQIPVTDTQAPTVTSTSTLTVTATLTPIPTETKSPNGLTKGEALSDSRVTLKLRDIKYNQGKTRVGPRSIAPIVFVFDFTNNSGETILLQIDQTTFKVKDNLDREGNCEYWQVSQTNPSLQLNVGNGQTIEIAAFCGEGDLPPQVTTYTLSVTDLSSLPDSTWVHEVVR